MMYFKNKLNYVCNIICYYIPTKKLILILLVCITFMISVAPDL
jgi:hypothetical protein